MISSLELHSLHKQAKNDQHDCCRSAIFDRPFEGSGAERIQRQHLPFLVCNDDDHNLAIILNDLGSDFTE